MNVNVFFEISDTFVEKYGHKYLAVYDVDTVNRPAPNRRLWEMKAFSDRMWSEDDRGVKFIKNRRIQQSNTPVDMNFPVDMKEFFWIKLQSHKL